MYNSTIPEARILFLWQTGSYRTHWAGAGPRINSSQISISILPLSPFSVVRSPVHLESRFYPFFSCFCTKSNARGESRLVVTGEPAEGHFTHETESPWPLHFKHSCWWKRQSRSKFASHYAWGTNGVYMWMHDGCKVYMVFYMALNGSCFMVIWTFLETTSWR